MKQRTFYVEDRKITIKSKQRTSMRNPAGFYVWINEERFISNYLERERAEDACYVRWVKKHISN